MKKLMMIAAMMLMSMGAFAQNEVGQFTLKPMVGIDFATITNNENKMKVGLAAGVEGEYGITENFGVTAGILFAMQGAKDKNDSDWKMNTTYLNIPILANAYLFKGFAVKVGIQPGFLLSAKEKYTENNVSLDVDRKDIMNKVDFTIPIGVSYEYQNFVIDARYNWGLTNVYKNDEKSSKSKNSVLMFTVGYKFAL
jgi:hypothetical protein